MDAVRCFHLELESLLKTKYHTYENSETGKTTVACEKYDNS
jgi:tripeptidyl-peptidase-1